MAEHRHDTRRPFRAITGACVLVLFIACWPATPTTAESATGADVLAYRVDSDRSWLRVLVYKGGLLEGLGHNHVISHEGIQGTVSLDTSTGRAQASIELSVSEFVVDDPRLREIEGQDFPGSIPEKDKAGTRKNMLGRKLLDASNFPKIKVEVDVALTAANPVEANAAIQIKGGAHTIGIPLSVQWNDEAFTASGTATISHTDIGLKPFTAAFGALRVADQLNLKFEVHGLRQPLTIRP